MIPLNFLMNVSVQLVESESAFHRRFSSRALSVVCFPVELSASLENLISLPFQAVACVIRVPVKCLNAALRSRNLKEFESKLATSYTLLKTALKVVGFAIGSIFTLTLGVCFPSANFRLHHFFGLVSDKKADEEAKIKTAQQATEKAAAEEVETKYLEQVVEALKRTGNPAVGQLEGRLNAIKLSPLFDQTISLKKSLDALGASSLNPVESPQEARAEQVANHEVAIEPPVSVFGDEEDFAALDRTPAQDSDESLINHSSLVTSEKLA